MLDLILQHLGWYPLMQPRDVYKLVFQGVMGSEHLISSPEGFIKYLVEELEPLLPEPAGRLFEPIRPDRTLLRINLRPYKALQLGADILIPPLLETARTFLGDPSQLQAEWMDFVQSCEHGQVSNFEVPEIHQFTTWLEGLKFPAVHHSEVYNQEYQPAYRLISAQFAHQLGYSHAG
jgi:hypothetical protein